MAKATAESILDYSQALPQQKRVIRLWAATGDAPPRRVFQQRALLIHRPLGLQLLLFGTAISKS